MKAAIDAVPYAPAVKIGLQFKRRFWEEDEVSLLPGIVLGVIADADLPCGRTCCAASPKAARFALDRASTNPHRSSDAHDPPNITLAPSGTDRAIGTNDRYRSPAHMRRGAAICILDQTGKIEREGVVPSDPEAIAAFIKSRAPHVVRVGLETGATATWLWTELNKLGLPVICIDARHAKAALRMPTR
jgi:hypothetical protein